MPTRSANIVWNGGLQDGDGVVELSSSHAGSFEVSFPRRSADDADGVTSPEELIAAAHASCYAMQLSALLGKQGTPEHLRVRADVALGPDPDDGGFRLTGIRLTVRGTAQGVDDDAFRAAAEEAKTTCPVSKALAGVEITLSVGGDGAS